MNAYFQSLSGLRKLISAVFAILFIWSAIIQLNDPDPYHWFVIYLLVALLHALAMFKNLSRKLLWLVIIALLVYAFYHIDHFIEWLQIDQKNDIFGEMVYDKPYLEGTREFLGLLICATSLTYQLKRSK
jgi:hypothetical protein